MKGRLPLVVLCLLAFLAAAVQVSLADTPPPAGFSITVSVQPTPDPTFGKGEVELAYSTGFRALRVIMPWTYPRQADVVHDKDRLCNVAAPAAAHGMALFLNVIPGTPPVTAGQIRAYNQTLSEYLQNLIGNNGCAKQLAELDIQVMNEANYSRFWPEATAPEDYAHALIQANRFIHREVAKHGFTVPVRVIGGELASSHDPVGFMRRMFKEAQRMKVRNAFFDSFSYHCYGTSDSQLPTPPDAIRAELVSQLGLSNGNAVPLLCSEYAVGTVAPSTKVSRSLAASTEVAQGASFCQALSMAVKSRLAGFGWFRLTDDPAGTKQLPSGLYYYNPRLGQPGDTPIAKASVPRIMQSIAAANSGSTTDCN